MSKIHVRHQTLSSDRSFEDLVERVESVLEALRNQGNKIIGVIFADDSVAEKATIFYEFEKE